MIFRNLRRYFSLTAVGIVFLLSLSMFVGWACQRTDFQAKDVFNMTANQSGFSTPPSGTEIVFSPDTEAEKVCITAGWKKVNIVVNNIARRILWRGPEGPWDNGSIVVLHGGGGRASDFCTGDNGLLPQIQFTSLAVQQGFGVFVLDSTDGNVTDSLGRNCAKRFDFSILDRENIDLKYIEYVLTQLIPSSRPNGSNSSLFMTGLSTGGTMTIRASTHFDNLVTAFAPISAGDPYGMDTVCDPDLSFRESAIGILVDRDTRLEIINDAACSSSSGFAKESPWETSNPTQKPKFKQFHDRLDGVMDVTCMARARTLLIQKGYVDQGLFLLNANSTAAKDPRLHFWRSVYNQPVLDFFKSSVP